MKEETPMKEEPIQTVTVKKKNPKRQAAGKASAIARKVRKEELINELNKAKETCSSNTLYNNINLYIVGGSVLLIVFCYIYNKKPVEKELNNRNYMDMQ